MYTISFTKECGCFTRGGMVNNQRFASREEAKAKADEMMEDIEDTFCQKHHFELVEHENGYTVNVMMAQ